MAGSKSNKNDLTKSDLTRIEDLEEFIHEDDPEIDAQFLEETMQSLPITSEDDLADITTADLLSSIEQDTQEEIDQLEEELPELPSEHDDIKNEDNLNYEDQQDNFEIDQDSFEEDENFDYSSDDIIEEQENESSSNFFSGDEGNELTEEDDSYPETYQEEIEDEIENNSEDIIDEEQFLSDEEGNNAYEAFTEDEQTTDNEKLEDLVENLNKESQESLSEIEASLAENREDLSDLVNFVDNMTFGKVQMGGSPAFSILLSGLPDKFHEDIIIFLREVGLCKDTVEEKNLRLSLELNHLLIPQISEYSAIYIAGKMKNFCKNIQLGLADTIHSSEIYLDDNKGHVSIKNIQQNKEFKYTIEEGRRNELIMAIHCSSSSAIEGFQTRTHFGLITAKELIKKENLEDETNLDTIDFDEDSLILKLTEKAFEVGANAIVSMNFNVASLHNEQIESLFVIIQGDAVVIEEKIVE